MTWSSSDNTLAEISNDVTNSGVSLAIAAGTPTITATAGSVSGSAALTVRPTGFVYTGSLNTARASHTATLLYNGMALMAGGNGSSGVAQTLCRSKSAALNMVHVTICEHAATAIRAQNRGSWQGESRRLSEMRKSALLCLGAEGNAPVLQYHFNGKTLFETATRVIKKV